LVAVLLNVGKFYRKGATPERSEPEFYTLPLEFVKQHHDKSTSWERLRLRGLDVEIEEYKNEKGLSGYCSGRRNSAGFSSRKMRISSAVEDLEPIAAATSQEE